MGKQTPSVRSLLEHMIEWGDRLVAITGKIELDHFESDPAAAPGAAKCIEVIGEAASRILKYHPEFAAEHPELELAEAYRMRNKLSHGYESIDWSIVYKVSREEAATLNSIAKSILASLADDP